MDMLHRVKKNSYNNYLTNPVELSNINRLKGKILSLQRRYSEEYTQINETRVAGESVSTFKLEERRWTRTVIDKLLSEDGRVIVQEEDIRQHIHTYYTQLYSDEDLPTDDTFTCSQIIPEDCDTNNNCMGEITPDDILDWFERDFESTWFESINESVVSSLF